MSDWKSRAVDQTDPMVASRNAILASNASGVPINPNQTLPVPTSNGAAVPAVADWRTRAAPVAAATAGSWRDRAAPVAAEAGMSTGKVLFPFMDLGDRLKTAYAGRDQEIQDSVNATANGEQTEGEMMAQNAMSNASKFTDTAGALMSSVPVAGPALEYVGGKVMQGISALPMMPGSSGATVGEALSNFSKEHPRATRNLKAIGQGANLVGAAVGARAAGNALEANIKARPGVQKFMADESSGMQPKPPAPPTAAETGKIATENYDTANFLGAKFEPEQVANRFDNEIKAMTPKAMKNGKFTTEDTKFMNALEEFKGNTGATMTLEDVNRIDKAITDKISQSHIDPRFGTPDATGVQLMKLQTKLRQFVDEVPDAGNDALVNGRNAWATKKRMQDLELVADRASVAPGDPAKALQAGYRNLYNDKDRIAGWPKEAVALLKQAAQPSTTTKVLTAIAPRLTAAIMGASGNAAGAVGAHLVGMAGGTAAEAIAASRGAAVQRSLGESLMSKLRDVDVPAPEYPEQLQLAAPDKMSPLPMSDQQVTIAQKLMNKPAPIAPEDMSGGAVRTPVSQLGKLRDSVGTSKQVRLDRLSGGLTTGSMSQNKFVEAAMKDFQLNNQQARALAKEILRNGAKK